LEVTARTVLLDAARQYALGLLVRIASVTPAGQVTALASKSIVKSALLKKSFLPGHRRCEGEQLDPRRAEGHSGFGSLVMGVRNHLGNRQRVGVEETC
jgi:hypothetical protein